MVKYSKFSLEERETLGLVTPEDIQDKINSIYDDIDMYENEIDCGYIDPGETYELKRRVRDMKSEVSELKSLLKKNY